jgi:hypothetical protein
MLLESLARRDDVSRSPCTYEFFVVGTGTLKNYVKMVVVDVWNILIIMTK